MDGWPQRRFVDCGLGQWDPEEAKVSRARERCRYFFMPEDEFFDAVETGLDKIEEDRQLGVQLKSHSQQSQISTSKPGLWIVATGVPHGLDGEIRRRMGGLFWVLLEVDGDRRLVSDKVKKKEIRRRNFGFFWKEGRKKVDGVFFDDRKAQGNN